MRQIISCIKGAVSVLAQRKRILMSQLAKVSILNKSLCLNLFGVDCPENCAECDASQCITCDDGYQLDNGKECVLKSSTPTPTESGLSGSFNE